MANRLLFAFCLIFAICVHALAFIYFPEDKAPPKSSSINTGKGGLQIGFVGSAGNGQPLKALNKEPTPVSPQKIPEPIQEAPPKTVTESTTETNPIAEAEPELVKSHTPEQPVKMSVLTPPPAQPIIPKVAEVVLKTTPIKPRDKKEPPVKKKVKVKALKTVKKKKPIKAKPKKMVVKKAKPKPKQKPKKVVKKKVKKPIKKAKPPQVVKKAIEKTDHKKIASADSVKSTLTANSAENNNNNPATAQGLGTGKGNKGSNIPGAGNSPQGGGQQGELDAYHSAIMAWLEKHKRYPRMAKRRHQQGTAIVYFKIDRSGKVLTHNIRKGSGHRALDREVLAMLKRANPLPPAPSQLAGTTLEFTLPVAFNIKR